MVEKNSDSKETNSFEEFDFDLEAQTSAWEDSLGEKTGKKDSPSDSKKSDTPSGVENFLAGIVDDYKSSSDKQAGAATAKSLSMLGDALVSVATFASNPIATVSNAVSKVDKGGFKNLEVKDGSIEEVSTPLGKFRKDGTGENGTDKFVRVKGDSEESTENFDGHVAVKDGKVVVQDFATGKTHEFEASATKYSNLKLTEDGKVDHLESEGRSYRYIGSSDGKDQYLVTTPNDQEGRVLNGTVSVREGRVTVADADRGVSEVYHSESAAKVADYEQTRKLTVETTRAIAGSYIADSVDAALKDPSKIKQWYSDAGKSLAEPKPAKSAELVAESKPAKSPEQASEAKPAPQEGVKAETKPSPSTDAARAEAKGAGAAESPKLADIKLENGNKTIADIRALQASESTKQEATKAPSALEQKSDLIAKTELPPATPAGENKLAISEPNRVDNTLASKLMDGVTAAPRTETLLDKAFVAGEKATTDQKQALSPSMTEVSRVSYTETPSIVQANETSPAPHMVTEQNGSNARDNTLNASAGAVTHAADRTGADSSQELKMNSKVAQVSTERENSQAQTAPKEQRSTDSPEQARIERERKDAEGRRYSEAASSLNSATKANETKLAEVQTKAGQNSLIVNLERNAISALKTLDANTPMAKSLIEASSKVPAEAVSKMIPQPLNAKELSSVSMTVSKIDGQIFRSEITTAKLDPTATAKTTESRTAQDNGKSSVLTEVAKVNTAAILAGALNQSSSGRQNESARSQINQAGTLSQGGRNENVVAQNGTKGNFEPAVRPIDNRTSSSSSDGLRVDPITGRTVRLVDIGTRTASNEATAIALASQTRHTPEGRYMIAEVTLAVVLAAGGIRRVLPTDKSSSGGNSGANNETRKLIERELNRLKDPVASGGLKFSATNFKLSDKQMNLTDLKNKLQLETLRDGRKVQLSSSGRLEILKAFRETKTDLQQRPVKETKQEQTRQVSQPIQVSFGLPQPRLMPLAAEAMSAGNFAMPTESKLDRLFQTQKHAMGEALRPLLGSQDFIVMDDPFQSFRDALAAKKQGSGERRYRDEAQDEENKAQVLLRPSWLISPGETLVSLAEEHYNDPYIAWLIADLNIGNCNEHYMDGKRIVEFHSRQKITLPVWQDIVEFYGKMSAKVKPENLITIVSDTEIDREVVDSVLGPIVTKQNFSKASVTE